MESKRLLMIVNPCSGKAKMKTELLSVVQIFSNAGFEVTVYPTKERGDATSYISTVQQEKYERIVVCGGDGTLNEVITGMMNSGLKCKLGYIPSGTLNEWSSGLHISRNIQQAARDIVDGEEKELDIGMFGNKYFSYTASFGAFTSASYSAPQDIKNVLGQAAYFFEGIKSLTSIKPIPLCLEADGRRIEGKFLFGAISNSMSVGGVVKFKDALVKLNDGLFEVMLVRNPANIIQFQSIVDGILRQDLTRDGIEFFHAKEIKLIGAADIDWTLDGEYSPGADEIIVKNLPRALHLVLPNITQKNLVEGSERVASNEPEDEPVAADKE